MNLQVFRCFTAFALMSAVGCSSSKPSPIASQPKPEPSPQADKIRPLHDHMQEHFVRADLMQKALIAGDLVRVRREADWLLERPEPDGMPAAWTPFILELMDSAAFVRTADAPRGMAQGIARMGAACGHCHQSLGLELNLSWDEPPRETTDPRIHMLRHQWATERFWDALVAADDRGWKVGAEVFREEALYSDELTPGGKIDPHIRQVATDLHDIGQRAADAMDVADRVTVFSTLIATCAACHHDAGRGPASPPEIE